MGVIFTASAQHSVPHGYGFSVQFISVLGHTFVYAVLAALVFFGLPRELSLRRRALLAFAITALYGASDEFHQSFVPGRDATLGDLLNDSIAAAVVVSLLTFVAPRLPGRWRR
jgi:VanZ family protein